MSYLRLWRYRVTPGHEAEFVRAYGPTGDWAQLFRRAEGFHATELLHPHPPADAYATIDRWQSEAHWEKFLAAHGDDYRALDRRLAPLTQENIELGAFTAD